MDVKGISQGGQLNFDTSRVTKEVSIGQNDIKPIEIPVVTEKNESDIKEKDIKKAVDKLNRFLEDEKTHAEYEVHDKFKDVMIKIVDDKTGDIVQELPPKKVLDMVAKMCELVGVIFDKKA